MRPVIFGIIAVLSPLTTNLLGADPALMSLVMPEAKVLAGVNFDTAKQSPFGQFLLAQLPSADSFGAILATAGFNPRTDISEVLMAFGSDTNASGLILVKGDFKPERIAAAMEKDGGHAAQTYSGIQMFVGSGKGDPDAIAFLSNNIAVIGHAAAVKAAIDRRTVASPIDPLLAAKAIQFSHADVWGASVSPLQMPNGAGDPLGGVMKSIQQATASVNLSSPIQISVEATAASEKDASSLADVVKFLVSMTQGGANASLMNSLNVTTDHNLLKLELSIPENQLEQMIQSGSPVSKPAGHI